MITVKFTPKGVLLAKDNNLVEIFHDSKELENLIEELQRAKTTLVEHQNRSAEEGLTLWEAI